MSGEDLSQFFDRLALHRRAEVGELNIEDLASRGISVHGEEAVLGPEIELLDASAIRQGLSQQASIWLRSLEIKSATGSTNSDLMQIASEGIDGRVVLAETQLGGRGRRGRTWISPFARNIALTMGLSIERKGHELASLSLTVGLAILKALESFGVSDLALKWPNDILFRRRKLCGVLIEVDHSRSLPQAVVGIGINHGGADLVRGRIDQELADLTECESSPGRNETAAAVVSAVHEYSVRFNEHGFAPLAREWESNHLFHCEDVRVLGGTNEMVGKVLGVSNLGELRVQTIEGERLVSGGEISMRPFTSTKAEKS